MNWHTGDRVVHSQYGAGVVRGQRVLTTNGETREYLLIDALTTHSTVYVERLTTADDHLRAAITIKDLPAVIAILAAKPHPLPRSAIERQALLHERLTGWQALNLAGVIRDLAALHGQNSVEAHQTDHDLLKKARLWLSAEWSLAAHITLEAAQQQIDETLEHGPTRVASPA